MCTRILWNDNGVATVAARTMDWSSSDEPHLWVLPAGLEHPPAGAGSDLRWTSQYASAILTMWDAGTSDGVNSAGLSAHALYLDDVAWGDDDGRPSVPNLYWVQYLLDTYGSVAEVVAHVDDVRIYSIPVRGQDMGCHIALEDASGDSAILEPDADGTRARIVVHHGREHTVMSNSPLFDEQLANRARYRPFGGELPPPGDISSLDRFVRASYYHHYLPAPATADHALAGISQIADTVTVPAGAPYTDGVYPTWWRSAVDLSNRTYYFWGTASPAAIWLDLDKVFADAAVAGVRRLDPQQPQLVGEASDVLEPATLPF